MQTGHLGLRGQAERRGGIEGSIIDCLDRLEALLADEPAVLMRASSREIGELNERKNGLLLELDQASRASVGIVMGEAVADRLDRVRTRLQSSLAAIEVHLAATNTIMRALRTAVDKYDTDGTYSRTKRRDEWVQ